MTRLVLERYRLGPVIGRGGMSTVYRALDTQTGVDVAVKVLAPHLSRDPQFRARLFEEARSARSLPHPRVVQVLDVGESAGRPEDGDQDAGPHGTVVLVMELVPGESLDRRLSRSALPVAEATELAAQVAEALDFAHRRGIIHRDVKPGNILLTPVPDGGGAAPAAGPAGAAPAEAGGSVTAKLADFGIARSLDAASSYTATGVVIGSVRYLAPELLNGDRAGAATDIYALGVTLFEMLTGRTPFGGDTASLAARLTADPPRVSTLRPDVPRWLDELVARTIAREPAQRLPDAAALARALRDADGAAGTLRGAGQPSPDDATIVLPALAGARTAPPAPRPAGAPPFSGGRGRAAPSATPPPPAGRTAATPAGTHRRRGRPERPRRLPVYAAAGAGVGLGAALLLVWLGPTTAARPTGDRPGPARAATPTTAPAVTPSAAASPSAAPAALPTPTAVVIRPQ